MVLRVYFLFIYRTTKIINIVKKSISMDIIILCSSKVKILSDTGKFWLTIVQ